MELSPTELSEMLADARRAAAEEVEERLAGERERLQTELAAERRRATDGWTPNPDAPTLASAVTLHLDGCSPGTRRTYSTYLERVLVAVPPCHGRAQLGDDGTLHLPPVDLSQELCRDLGCDPGEGTHATFAEVAVSDMRDRERELKLLLTWVRRNAKAKEVRKLCRERLRLLRSEDPEVTLEDVDVDLSEIDPATGTQAQRSFVTAVRALFKAQMPKYLDRSPAAALKMPKKTQTNRVAFDVESGQLEQVLTVGIDAASDPELVEVLCDFYLETGARLNEAFRLTHYKVNVEDCLVKIGQKNDEEQWVPISPSTLARILDLAQQRGMSAADPWVFRNRRGQRASKAHMDKFWQEVKARLPFAAEMDAATHCFRKTMATLIEREFGVATSEAFLRHRHVPVSLLYPKASLTDVATALAALTREPHPRARGRWSSR